MSATENFGFMSTDSILKNYSFSSSASSSNFFQVTPTSVGALIVSSGVATFTVHKYWQYKDEKKQRSILHEKRVQCQEEREKEFKHLESLTVPLSQESIKILELSFDELQNQLQNKNVKCKDVLKAYVGKAILDSKKFNCVTRFVPEMWSWTQKLDSMPADEIVGPLHGIPVCIKDDHDIEGMDSTLGLAVNLNNPAPSNSAIVQQLLDLGAVPFCKSNVPQTLWSSYSHNPIYGLTTNSVDSKFRPGGSSSGSATLVGTGGTPFALGSDIGGSLRLPAHFCGICTLKPTVGRISGKGIVQCVKGCAGITGVTGVLAKRVKTLETVFKCLTAGSLQNQYDPLVPPISWDEQDFTTEKKVKIGYCTSMPLFPALGDTPMVMEDAVNVLKSCGHSLIPYEIPENYYLVKVFNTIIKADGGNQNYKRLKYDEISDAITDNSLKTGKPTNNLFTVLKQRITALLSYLQPSKNRVVIPGDEKAQDSEILWDYLEEQRKLKYLILDEMNALDLDLILMPSYPFPATRIGSKIGGCILVFFRTDVYISIWNLLNFPAGVVPFGQELHRNTKTVEDFGDPNIMLAKQELKHCKGMPIGVQIIGKPFKEEIVLRIMAELDEHNCNNSTS